MKEEPEPPLDAMLVAPSAPRPSARSTRACSRAAAQGDAARSHPTATTVAWVNHLSDGGNLPCPGMPLRLPSRLRRFDFQIRQILLRRTRFWDAHQVRWRHPVPLREREDHLQAWIPAPGFQLPQVPDGTAPFRRLLPGQASCVTGLHQVLTDQQQEVVEFHDPIGATAGASKPSHSRVM